MACAGGMETIRITRAVWSDGTTTPQFLSFAQRVVNKHKKARITVSLEGSSGNLTVSAAAIYGNNEDGVATSTTTSDFPTGSPTTRTTNGISYPASYTDLDTSGQLVEFGVNVKNTSGSKREMGTVTLVIELSD